MLRDDVGEDDCTTFSSSSAVAASVEEVRPTRAMREAPATRKACAVARPMPVPYKNEVLMSLVTLAMWKVCGSCQGSEAVCKNLPREQRSDLRRTAPVITTVFPLAESEGRAGSMLGYVASCHVRVNDGYGASII